MRHLTKDKFRIKLNPVFFQQGEKLCVETHLFVVRGLILNVTNDHGNIRATYTKRPISLLPREFAAFPVRPF